MQKTRAQLAAMINGRSAGPNVKVQAQGKQRNPSAVASAKISVVAKRGQASEKKAQSPIAEIEGPKGAVECPATPNKGEEISGKKGKSESPMRCRMGYWP